MKNMLLILVLVLSVFMAQGCSTQKSYCEGQKDPEGKKEDCALFFMMVYSKNPNDRAAQAFALHYCLSAIEAQKECDKKSEYLPNFND